METELKDKQATEATIQVTLDAGRVNAAFDAVLNAYARQVRVPGFRPGKAPRGVLIRRIGEENLVKDARETLVEEAYAEAVRQHELAPVHAHVHGDDPVRDEPFTFDLHVDLYPEVALPNLDELVLDSEEQPVAEETVQETIRNLQRQHATLVPVDRPVEASDQVMIETLGEDGEPREEGAAMPVDMETVGDAIAEQLLGTKVGDVVDLKVEDPTAEVGEDGTPGTTVMQVRVQDVKAKEKPNTDDEFATTLGFASWQDVIDAIRDGHEQEAAKRADEARREELTDKLIETVDPPVPGTLLRRREAALLENLGEDLKRRGIGMEQYLANLKREGKEEEFRGELTRSAERAVKRDLVLDALLEAHPVEVSDEELSHAVTHLAQQSGTSPEAFRKDRGEEWLENYRYLLRRDRALRATVERLVAKQDGSQDPPQDELKDEAQD